MTSEWPQVYHKWIMPYVVKQKTDSLTILHYNLDLLKINLLNKKLCHKAYKMDANIS